MNYYDSTNDGGRKRIAATVVRDGECTASVEPQTRIDNDDVQNAPLNPKKVMQLPKKRNMIMSTRVN